MSLKELRTQPGRIISMVGSGNNITITMRGKPVASIVPLDDERAAANAADELPAFGMWKDRDDMRDPSEFVAALRKGREF